MGLSMARAAAIRNYLVYKKAPTENLLPIGYGQSKPVADNHTPEGRAENRRVEFVPIETQEAYERAKAYSDALMSKWEPVIKRLLRKEAPYNE
jgi:hypothetical protein